jgi:hypothetical protein
VLARCVGRTRKRGQAVSSIRVLLVGREVYISVHYSCLNHVLLDPNLIPRGGVEVEGLDSQHFRPRDRYSVEPECPVVLSVRWRFEDGMRSVLCAL